jgi:CubicO group peptidase (beta-lactamase class C family)
MCSLNLPIGDSDRLENTSSGKRKSTLKNRSASMLSAVACLVTSSAVPGSDCAAPNLFNGLDINIPCVAIGKQRYATTLLNEPPGSLNWRWDGQLTPVDCQDAATCARLDEMDLSFPSLTIDGQDHYAALEYAPDLHLPDPDLHFWRYVEHGLKWTENLDDTDLQQLRQYIRDAVDNGAVPGAVLGVTEAGRFIMLEAFGESDTALATAATTDHLFHVGSTHKAITSLLIATLVDEGTLHWDSKAVDIYPDFTLSRPDYAARITLRQLLDMTSGLPQDAQQLSQARELLEGLGGDARLYPPGSAYRYSNVSVSIAGYLAVLAKVQADNGRITEQDLDDLHAGYVRLLQERVLTPLGMTSSYIDVDEARSTGNMASSHVLHNGRFQVAEPVDQQVQILAPAGSLKSTAGDMLRFVMTELLQGISPGGTRLVSATNMAVRQSLSSGPAAANDYGLCLDVVLLDGNLRYVGHPGHFDNFNSVMGFFPDRQIGFVLLTNGESDAALELTGNGVVNRFAELLDDK